MGEEMREIKFKIWDKKNKRWYIQYPNCNNLFNVYKDGTLGRNSEDDDYIFVEFIGLKDKDGKEIYEGYILEDNFNNRGSIVWIEPGFEWLLTKVKAPPRACFWESCKIIGNVFENPTLMEVKK